MRRGIVLLMCALVMLCGGCRREPMASSPNALTVHMLDVGEADCFLLTQGDSAMLIDAGSPDSEEHVISYLSSLGVKRLDYVLMTHPHADHVGGAEQVMTTFDVGEVWCVDVPQDIADTTLLHERLDSVITEKGIATREVSTVTQVMFGDATVMIYPRTKHYRDVNDYSAVCMVTFAGKRLLMTGDVSNDRVNDLLSAGYDLAADVLKFPHHGAHLASCEALLDEVNPQYVLLSCDSDREDAHPAKSVVQALDAHDVTVFRSDRDGTVKMEMTRDGIYFETSC